MFIAASQHGGELKIWGSDVRGLRASAVRQWSSIAPNSPLTRFKKRPSVDIYAPHRTLPFPHHGGLRDDYEIEPFRPVFVAPEQMDIHHSSNLPEAMPLPPPAAAATIPLFTKPIPPPPPAVAPIIPMFTKFIPPLPRDMGDVRPASLSQVDMLRGLVSSIEYASSGLHPGPVSGQSKSQSLPSPSPLGDWPRQDVMKLPAKPRRKPLPPSAFEFPNRHMATMTCMASTDGAPGAVPADTVTQPRPRRPSGPRMRVPSGENGHRPAPLDLTGISNYDTGRRDDTESNV